MLISAFARNIFHQLKHPLLCFLLLSGTVSAELMLYPTRVVFENNQRSAQLELINQGDSVATYRISLVNRRMGSDGSFAAAETARPGEQFADELLRYSPRQVTLEPGAGQTVRIMVRKPANLDAGEYRSHLLFTKQPEANPRNGQPQVDTESGEIGISVSLLIGASIPVIVRHGNTEAEVSLSNLAINQPSPNRTILSVQINRQGNQSVYGDIAVSFTPEGGKEQIIARANGLAVYTPNSHRFVNLNLTTPESGSLSGGRLKVVYRQQAEQGGAVLAETAARVR